MMQSQPEPVINDPRGRGFRSRITVEQFQNLISETVIQFRSETILTTNSHRRVLAHPIRSNRPIPSFDRAAMDGFALIANETYGSDHYTPSTFTCIGQSWPGQGFIGKIQPGETVAIATGAPVPDGADAIVPVEYTEVIHDIIKVRESVTPGRHIGQVGEDVQPDLALFPSGRVLRPQDLGILSGLGIDQISVVKQPRIAIIITGNEVVPAFETASGYKISDMNSPMLASLVERDGGLPLIIGPLSDDFAILQDTILELANNPEIQAIFINGGSSTGPEDFAPSIVALDGQLLAHGVALRPASPTGLGLIAGKPVLLIPGNPVSCLCAYDFFGTRIVRILAGRPIAWAYPQMNMQLSQKITSALGRVDYVRVRFNDGQIEPMSIGGASILSGTTRADGFVVVPADHEGYPSGTFLDVWCYDIP